MLSNYISELEEISREIVSASDNILTWKWDQRLEAVLSEFSIAETEIVRSILDKHLTLVWEGQGTGDIEKKEKTAGSPLGDVRSGQLLFISDTAQDAYLFCAWWPWGNGQTISVRMAPYIAKIDGEQKVDLIYRFKGWFSV